jgi:hypothetical protein
LFTFFLFTYFLSTKRHFLSFCKTPLLSVCVSFSCISPFSNYTSGCPWPSATVKSPGFFKLGSRFSFF